MSLLLFFAPPKVREKFAVDWLKPSGEREIRIRWCEKSTNMFLIRMEKKHHWFFFLLHFSNQVVTTVCMQVKIITWSDLVSCQICWRLKPHWLASCSTIRRQRRNRRMRSGPWKTWWAPVMEIVQKECERQVLAQLWDSVMTICPIKGISMYLQTGYCFSKY